ncbi:redoxin [Actibacterium atlanticum]|uniref:Redoxin n=1 Tax=Actibacterium atlanticum TaxID=1461693 RepID=A0A058ZHT0_9RHOB|nr:TlpA disulfide reductase family protein [Actibacterium atlanticum]KCV81148.1 redoxin [Actibacterium atlanticum]
MRLLRSVVLYTALALGANAAVADTAALEALRDGSMKKLNFHRTPVEVAEVGLVDMDDAPRSLSEFEGQYVLLNFWATWCPPCRKEMPGLGALQTELGSDDFQVVTVATGFNKVQAISKFFDEIEVDNLPLLRDPKQALAREMAVLGLPVTVILNPEGQEIARMQGDAHWDSDSAKAIITALVSE